VGLLFLVGIANSTGTYAGAAKSDMLSGLRLAGLIGAGLLILGGFLALAIKKQPPAVDTTEVPAGAAARRATPAAAHRVCSTVLSQNFDDRTYRHVLDSLSRSQPAQPAVRGALTRIHLASEPSKSRDVGNRRSGARIR
jgi:hypothetical protein